MKNNLLIALVLSLCVFWSCGQGQKTITVENPTENDRSEVISIPFDKFTRHFGVDTVFTVKDASGKVYMHQLEKLGQASPQNVLILVDIASEETLSLTVQSDTPPAFDSKTFARYVPERFDDFAWENDVVAFRMYGKALEGRSDDAQGMDYWAKRTDKLIVNSWYEGNDYHKDHGEGLDYYSVGQTLGAGDIALFSNDSIRYTKHYRTYEILDNGPVRTAFVLNYDAEKLDDQEISLKKTITIDAGSNFNKIQVELDKATDIVTGLAKRKEPNPRYEVGENNRHLAYWEPDVQNHGETGVAVILPEGGSTLIADRAEQFLLPVSVSNDKPFVYYNGAAWNRGGKVSNAEQWFSVVKKQQENIDQPLLVTLK